MAIIMKILTKLGSALLTEYMVKVVVLELLEVLVRKTKWEGDDKILEAAKNEWSQ